MSGYCAVICFRRPLADHDHVSELTGVLRAPPRTPPDLSRPQASSQLAPQLAAALHEQGLIDRLVAHMHHRIVGELHPQPTGDLLRRPPLLQPLRDLGGEPGTGQLRCLGATGAVVSPSVCAPGAVVIAASVAGHFPRHR
jgi:hypothetical protein